jgi:hypothetical protein
MLSDGAHMTARSGAASALALDAGQQLGGPSRPFPSMTLSTQALGTTAMRLLAVASRSRAATGEAELYERREQQAEARKPVWRLWLG